ncbi:MAG TPA: hypothetical protein VFS51_03400 [Gemmatimonadales bacterium]|nr:hypothetical protein [Gemmatimonadales bacterium]
MPGWIDDLQGAQSVIRAGPREAGAPAVALTTVMWFWALEDADQQRLLHLTQVSFNGHREAWAFALAQIYWLRGDRLRARAYADSARQAYEALLRTRRNDYTDAIRHASLGLMLAFLDRKSDDIREGERGRALLPVTKDAVYGVWIQRQLARSYLLVGEPDRALDLLEPLLEQPSYLGPGWLRIDPTPASLRGNPRFERLAATTPAGR